MKRVTSGLKASLFFSALLVSGTAAVGQSKPRSAPAAVQPATRGAQPTSSNPWESLPSMSTYHCLAEALGTASDPKTGAPVRAAVDPSTGKPVCPPKTQTAEEPRTLNASD